MTILDAYHTYRLYAGIYALPQVLPSLELGVSTAMSHLSTKSAFSPLVGSFLKRKAVASVDAAWTLHAAAGTDADKSAAVLTDTASAGRSARTGAAMIAAATAETHTLRIRRDRSTGAAAASRSESARRAGARATRDESHGEKRDVNAGAVGATHASMARRAARRREAIDRLCGGNQKAVHRRPTIFIIVLALRLPRMVVMAAPFASR